LIFAAIQGVSVVPFERLKLEKERDRRPEASFTKVSVAMRLGFLNPLCTLLCLYSLRQLRL